MVTDVHHCACEGGEARSADFGVGIDRAVPGLLVIDPLENLVWIVGDDRVVAHQDVGAPANLAEVALPVLIVAVAVLVVVVAFTVGADAGAAEVVPSSPHPLGHVLPTALAQRVAFMPTVLRNVVDIGVVDPAGLVACVGRLILSIKWADATEIVIVDSEVVVLLCVIPCEPETNPARAGDHLGDHLFGDKQTGVVGEGVRVDVGVVAGVANRPITEGPVDVGVLQHAR